MSLFNIDCDVIAFFAKYRLFDLDTAALEVIFHFEL